MKFWVLRKNKICFMLLLYVLIQGFALGQHVYASGDYVTLDAIYVNNVAQSDKNINVVYDYINLVDSFTQDNVNYYVWETNVSIYNTLANITDGMYSYSGNLYINFEFPSNVAFYGANIEDISSNTNSSNVLRQSAYSSHNRYIRAGIALFAYRQQINKNYPIKLTSFKIRITTLNNTRPTLSATKYSTSGIYFYNNVSDEQLIINAINNSQSADDIALILTQARTLNTNLTNVYNRLGITNTTLDTISGYAYEIWNILNNAYPTEASSAMDDAEEQFNNIAESMSEYALVQPDSNRVNTNARDNYFVQTQDFDSDDIFWYYSWPWVLGILVMVFGIAIISYVLYGGK